MMEALTTILFLATGTSLVVMTILRLMDIRLSNVQSGMLTPQLDAALSNGNTGDVVSLCHNYDDSSLARIVKAVVARADRIPGSDGVRSEALKLLIDQAANREIDRLRRGLVALHTAALTAAPLGVVAGALAANQAIFSTPAAMTPTELSDAMIYAAEGFILSIIAFIAYKCLSAKADAEVLAVEELCDHLHGLLLLRRQESSSDPTLPR
jgi:biopolymer transport protein ExbB/TolQ